MKNSSNKNALFILSLGIVFCAILVKIIGWLFRFSFHLVGIALNFLIVFAIIYIIYSILFKNKSKK